jgi:transcriptional regulator with XRE-family HTH domain
MSTTQDTATTVTDTRDAFWKQFRDNLQELLEAWGMTQKDLAKEAGIPYSTLNKKMRGVHRTWWAVDLARFYHVFGPDPLLFRGLSESVAEDAYLSVR